MEGGDLRVVPLEIHKVEKVLGSLLLTSLSGRKQGVSLSTLLGSLDTEGWHKDSAPRDNWWVWGQPLCGHPGDKVRDKVSVPSWSHGPLCQAAALAPCWCQGGRTADWGI